MTSPTEHTIILCGGSINYSNLPIGTNLSNAMIPVNGKPVIGWILNDLLDKGITEATVVLRAQDERLQAFLQRNYRGRMDITIVPLNHDGTIIQSLQGGLSPRPDGAPVRILLGDTLIRDSFAAAEDFVYSGTVDETRRWCILFKDGDDRITDLVDKQADLDVEPKLALAGYYHLRDGDHLAACVEASVAAGERELSRVLLRYNATHPIRARMVEQWFDFGNIDNLADARRQLLVSRHFNTLTINPVLHTITKVSENNAILSDELDWYLNIPDELQVLTPRIVNYRREDGQIQIVQEYYGYPTLAELFIYGDLPTDTWVSILRHVMRILQEFGHYQGALDSESLHTMYSVKTWRRLDALREQSAYWAEFLRRETVEYNGQVLQNIPRLRPLIEDRIETLLHDAPICVTHGDYCFSNILFDVNYQIIRLIDPRGSFGRKGIYGDARYDVAKLRHSVHGLYDYIITDMFEIHEQDSCFSGTVYANDGILAQVGAAFDDLVAAAGYDLDDIRFIEGLLFISMGPLHRDRFERQQIMFLTGLTLLNEVLVEG
jgi:dTDP-glucose pyrophosphorylase